MTETERITKIIGDHAPLDEMGALEELASEFLSSKKREWMEIGQRYYQNQDDILKRRRWVIGENGAPKEDPTLVNCRISHGFMRKLADQKCQYLFGRAFTFRTESQGLERELCALFGRELRGRIKNLCKEAVNKGIAWLQVYIEDGQLGFAKIPAEQVAPIWEDGEHTRLSGVLRLYAREEYRGKEKIVAVRAEHWHQNGVDGYASRAGLLVPDPELWGRPHLWIEGKPYNFRKIPFIPFKYNEEEMPLIQFIKPLLDDYDLLKSEDANTLLDSPNAVMVLTNYDGTDLGEFRRNLSQYKAVKVMDNGGLDIKAAPNVTAAVNAHLERTRKDLYEVGRGVDTQRESFGNLSGVALKFLYADLDLDCNGLEVEFAQGFERMLEFIKIWLALTGRGDYGKEAAQLVLNRDILINEAEAIAGCVQSAGLLSEKTILENHPWVESVGEEYIRLKNE